ncbi:MAG: hypothetical protein OJF50_003398 [Nitrospira sp.]|nr:hypothetical protein [Nitrospira sp.]
MSRKHEGVKENGWTGTGPGYRVVRIGSGEAAPAGDIA